MIFVTLNPGKIRHENLTDFSTSPVRRSHFTLGNPKKVIFNSIIHIYFWLGGSIAEWLARWTQAQKAWVQISAATLSGNSLRQTVHTHRASVHQAAKLVAGLLRVVRVTAGLVESNGSLQPGLWLTSPTGWLLRTGISSGILRSVIEYGLPFTSDYLRYLRRKQTVILLPTPPKMSPHNL